ncbi:hypothetical protein NW768_007552 [Fusarium equiseti]|uniref:Uncharacterized protein n=1 Tax=Fusarium equiseti TaxID=61235 RepID=A0ABQ8R854_FUSEQ|nr:hypothetical protein NW768_007552 [Fusarium equiseti]
MSSSPTSPTMFNIKDLGRDTWTSVMDILALFQELDSSAGKEAVAVFMEKYSTFLTEVDREAAALNAKLAQIPILEAALKGANDREDHEAISNISDLQMKVQHLETALSEKDKEIVSLKSELAKEDSEPEV